MAVAHDIRDVEITPTPAGFVVACGCGWINPPTSTVRAAAEDWQRHREDC